MVQLDEQEQVVLRDMLDMDIEQFKHAMHEDEKQGGFDSWEALLKTTGGYGDTIQILERIRRKVDDDIANRGSGSTAETV